MTKAESGIATLPHVEDTVALGSRLGGQLHAGDVVVLSGPLGVNSSMIPFNDVTNKLPLLSKASPSGKTKPEAKVLCAPVGVTSVMYPGAPSYHPTNRLPELSKVSAEAKSAPWEATILGIPADVNSATPPPKPANRLPELSKASPDGTFKPEAKMLGDPEGVNSIMLPF